MVNKSVLSDLPTSFWLVKLELLASPNEKGLIRGGGGLVSLSTLAYIGTS
jgi:hypothetical protein